MSAEACSQVGATRLASCIIPILFTQVMGHAQCKHSRYDLPPKSTWGPRSFNCSTEPCCRLYSLSLAPFSRAVARVSPAFKGRVKRCRAGYSFFFTLCSLLFSSATVSYGRRRHSICRNKTDSSPKKAKSVPTSLL